LTATLGAAGQHHRGHHKRRGDHREHEAAACGRITQAKDGNRVRSRREEAALRIMLFALAWRSRQK